MRWALLKVKGWENVIKLLDGLWETAVQLSVLIVYRYGGYCCVCHWENIAIYGLKRSVLLWFMFDFLLK